MSATSMALDPSLRSCVARGDWPGALAVSQTHFPFWGPIHSGFKAVGQGAYVQAALHTGVLALDVAGLKGAWRNPAGARVAEGPGQNATRVPVKTRDILANPESFKGASVADVEKHIPKGWKKLPAKKGEGGVRYLNPDKPGESIMIELGNPASKDPKGIHKGLYLRIAKDGEKIWVPLKGNPTLEKK